MRVHVSLALERHASVHVEWTALYNTGNILGSVLGTGQEHDLTGGVILNVP